ncbi:MAG: nucleoside deaminase [Bacteroidota bacterium]
MENNHQYYIEKAIELALENVSSGKGGPFGAVIVKNGFIIATGSNSVTQTNDPTAHAEVLAIRNACNALQSFQLDDCVLYSSCEPCPMCLGAIYWARPAAVYFAATNLDAAKAGFDDSFIYKELALPLEKRTIPTHQLQHIKHNEPFEKWISEENKIKY